MRSNAPVEHCVAERLSQWGDSSATETSRILIYLPLVEALGFPHLDKKSHKKTSKEPYKRRMQNMSIAWIFKMQDLSVDKTVDSVNKSKWAQMVTNGDITVHDYHNYIM